MVLIAIILNYINFIKSYKRGFFSSIFFITKTLLIIFLFEFIFKVLKVMFKINSFDFRVLFSVFLFSVIFYFRKRKYSCLTFSLTFSFALFKVLGVYASFREAVFLVGALHLFEGINVLLCSEKRMFISLPIENINALFMIFYSRNFYWDMFKFGRVISGLLILSYGIIVLSISYFESNFIFIILVCILHEVIYFIERELFNKLTLKKQS